MIEINYRDSRPIFVQVKENFRREILSGILPTGEKLPSVRELAAQLAINPNTIQRAYRELEAEGIICSVAGKGSFVAEVSDATLQQKEALKDSLRGVLCELRSSGANREELLSVLEEVYV